MSRVTPGGNHPWELEKRGPEISLRVDGQLAVNSVDPARSLSSRSGLAEGVSALPRGINH
jgi:hypothetical protein